MNRAGSAVRVVAAFTLLLLSAACELLDQTPPPNIPATVVAEGATVAAQGATVAAQAATEAREAVSTVVALATPEPTSTRAAPTPELTQTPPPTPTTPPTPTPPLVPGEARSEMMVTSMGRDVDVTVTGFPDNALRSEQLALAINKAEELLGTALPAPTVTLQLVNGVAGGFCGNNQPSYAPPVDGGPHIVDGSVISVTIDEDCDDVFATIAHEVAHTWFHGSAESSKWIDEGLANAIERQVVAAVQPEPDEVIYPPVSYCRDYANISELEQANPDISNVGAWSGFSCHYSLGDGLFGELQEHYGPTGFNQRIVDLGRQASNETDRQVIIDDVRTALGGDATALAIIDRWYAGQPEMLKYRHLDAVEWTFPPTIDGQYLHFAGRTTKPGVVGEFILEDHAYCSQFSLLDDAAGQQWVTSIGDPLIAGWIHAELPAVVAINGLINPETGEFSLTARINDPFVASLSELSLLVNGRSMAGQDGLCEESVRYSQASIESGSIPDHLKAHSHYHADAIEWISPPTVVGNSMTFSGRAQPGAISLEWQDGYCSQLSIYELDAWGYHFIDSLDPKAPLGQFWGNSPTGEITSYRTGVDGSFAATATLTPGVLDPYDNPILMVTASAPVDTATQQCVESEVLSAVDIQRN